MNLTGTVEGLPGLFGKIDPERQATSIRQGLSRAAIQLSNIVKADKLNGQVLGNVTGTLYRSIHERVEVSEDGFTAFVGSFAGYLTPGPHPAEAAGYARINEYGATVNVPAHTRQCTMVFGRELESPVECMVKAHTAVFPERSFLRSALSENKQMVVDEIRKGIKAALRAE